MAVFAEAEAELVTFFEPLTVSGCDRAMAAWRSGVEEDLPARAGTVDARVVDARRKISDRGNVRRGERGHGGHPM